MLNQNTARIAGLVCLCAGLLFFADFAVIGAVIKSNSYLSQHLSIVNLLRAILWVVVAVGLTGGAVGLLALGAAGAGWTRNLGFCGAFFNLMGAASYIAGTVFIYNFPERGTRQIFTPLGSLLLTLGMLILAVAVLSAGRLKGWRKFVPLLVALYFPLQFPLQAILFLGQGRGPNPLLLGSWGLLWALLGCAVWSAASAPTLKKEVLSYQQL